MDQIWAFPVTDTGQTTCYNDLGNILNPCPFAAEPFYGQDANYVINPPSYTKLDVNGNTLPDSATVWAMVMDNVTGLIWEVKHNADEIANYIDPNDADNKYTWYESTFIKDGIYPGTPGNGTDTEDIIKQLNDSKYGSYADWRLPTLDEIMTIIDYGNTDMAIDQKFFANLNSFLYWTSSQCAGVYEGHCTLAIDMTNGMDLGCSKHQSMYAIAVRGQNHTSNTYVDNQDGTVTHIPTGLMWQKNIDRLDESNYKIVTWEEALSYCEELHLANYTDWRLPTIKELESIIQFESTYAIDTTVFPESAKGMYWSATSSTMYADHAWVIDVHWNWNVYFPQESYLQLLIKQNQAFVRAVRNGVAEAESTILPDTGQHKCYDNMEQLTVCPRSEEDFYGQDAQYNAAAPAYRANPDGTVTDLNTKLVWQQYDDGLRRNWNDAFFYCESLELAGENDWRLPNAHELISIINARLYSPCSDPIFESKSGLYYSADRDVNDAKAAWAVNFSGLTLGSVHISTEIYSRCVRGKAIIKGFYDNGDGTITQTDTNLMWQTHDSFVSEWSEALLFCENSSFAGYTDWRAPNFRELESIIDRACFNPAVDSFFECYSEWHWTSTTSASNPEHAFSVNFYNGSVGDLLKIRDGFGCVICVRDENAISKWDDAYLNILPSCEDIKFLRRYRDNVIGKLPDGRSYINILYKYSDEALKTLRDNPYLTEKAASILADNIDSIKDGLYGKEVTICNTREILYFLDTFGSVSPRPLSCLSKIISKKILEARLNRDKFLGFRFE